MREFKCSEKEVREVARLFDVRFTSKNDRIEGRKIKLIRDALAARAHARNLHGTREETIESDDSTMSESVESGPERRRSPSETAFVTLRTSVGQVAGLGARRLHLHNDFVQWLVADTTAKARKNRANLVLRHLAAFGKTGIVKLVRGPGKGWRRSPLGGGHGMHYYLWWAGQGTPPVADLELDKNDIVIRAVRHHDDTGKPLSVGDWDSDYLALDPSELVNSHDDYGFAYHDTQRDIARSTAAVRFIKGHPGSGKTNSLWLSASLLEGRRALYLTYSERLAAEAEQYFSALGPASLTIEALSFNDFLTSVTRHVGRVTESARSSQRALYTAFAKLVHEEYRRRLGPWDGHLEELYAELHAHLIGRALPVPFQKQPAAEGMLVPEKAYRRLRERHLGTDAVARALTLGRYIESSGRLGELFPGPIRARDLLAHLEDPDDDRLRLRFADLDGIFVDEIQDLTLVESYFLMRLCAAVGAGRDRGIPAFIAAGDEGQTVRPTDFDWGELANLANDNIGRRSEWELTSNVRSPRKIAMVINGSWDLYRSLSRQDRPSGYARAHVDEATQGNVIYTQCRDFEEFVEFVEMFDALPNATLVYPDHSIPTKLLGEPVLASAIMTSRDAKGLGFQTVGVLSPGRQMDILQTLVDSDNRQRRLFELWGRALVDHLRVALSRATENLLLIDIDPDDEVREQVLKLCGKGAFLDMEPMQVIEFLRRDDRDAAELAAEFAEEVATLLGNQPMRAFRRAQQMTALLGDRNALTAVQDEALRAQAWQLLGTAAIDVLHRWDELDSTFDRQAVFRAGQRAFGQLDQPEHLHLLRFLNGCRAYLRMEWHEIAVDAEATLTELSRLDRQIARTARQALLAWCHTCAQQPGPDSARLRKQLRRAFELAATAFGDSNPEIHADHSRMKLAIARAALATGAADEALQVLQTIDPRDHLLEGDCHLELGQYAAAAECYERAGQPTAALRCLRKIPDVDGSLRIARQIGSGEADILSWLQRYQQLLAELTPEQAVQMTDAERRSGKKLAQKTLDQQLPKKPKN